MAYRGEIHLCADTRAEHVASFPHSGARLISASTKSLSRRLPEPSQDVGDRKGSPDLATTDARIEVQQASRPKRYASNLEEYGALS